MGAVKGKETWMWVSGLDHKYTGVVRAHVLQQHLSERSKRSQEKSKARIARRRGVELICGPRFEDNESTPSPGLLGDTTTGSGDMQGSLARMMSHSGLDIRSPSNSLVFYDYVLQLFCQYGTIPSQRGDSFMQELLFLESRNTGLGTVRKAARAGATVFYGHLSGNVVAVREGQKWGCAAVYGVNEGLRLVQPERQGWLGNNKTRNVLPSRDLIGASLMLAFYECTCGTSPTAWVHHVLGAEALLVMLGPERCQTGWEFELLRVLRYSAIQSSIISRKSSRLSWEPWLTQPFAKQPKDDTDALVDLLLTLPRYMRATENALSKGRHSADERALEVVGAHVLRLRNRLGHWWQEFDLNTSVGDRTSQMFLGSSHSAQAVSTSPSTSCPSPRRHLSDDLLVELKAKWDMGMLLAVSILATLETIMEKRHIFEAQCNVHAASILMCSDWIEAQEAQGNLSGLWHILLPLSVISMVCPDDKLRSCADGKLVRYGREKALGGVTTMNKLKESNIFGADWGIVDNVLE